MAFLIYDLVILPDNSPTEIRSILDDTLWFETAVNSEERNTDNLHNIDCLLVQCPVDTFIRLDQE